jgi:uncharacterized OB-fold protein
MSVPAERPPQPSPDEDTGGFWQALQDGTLAVCRCTECRRWLQPALERCPTCWAHTSFEPVGGTGEVFSFIVVHKPAIPGYRDKLPYAVALVELDEQAGLRLPARLVNVDPGEVRIGQRVRAEIQRHPGGDYHVAVFRPD